MRFLLLLFLFFVCIETDEIPPEQTIVLDEITIASKRPERFTDLSFLQQPFRDSVEVFLRDCESRGIHLVIVETYRTPDRQDRLKKRGRSRLAGDQSKHQHGLAIDVVPTKHGKFIWHDRKLWLRIGTLGERRGLKWGGRWKKFVDYPHFETK